MNNKYQHSSVLFGDSLNLVTPQISWQQGMPFLSGTSRGAKDERGQLKSQFIPLSSDLLSKHIMLLGGIGTGKTNAFYQIISQIQAQMTDQDVMILFDTKGDFKQSFYKPGDVVISNDDSATGPAYLDYWNIFAEIDRRSRLQENVIEISKALFAEACEKTNQVFFPNAARDLFMACLLHFIRSIPPSQQTNALTIVQPDSCVKCCCPITICVL